MDSFVGLDIPVNEGLLVSEADICAALSISPQTLREEVEENRMFSIAYQNRELYPLFFSDKYLPKDELAEVCKALERLPSGAKWLFLTNPSYSLGGITPLEALKQRKFKQVHALANTFAEL